MPSAPSPRNALPRRATERGVSLSALSCPGLRLALAYLYAVGDQRREWFGREPYDEFWRLATQVDANYTEGHNVDATGRLTQITANFNGIDRAAGMEVDVTVLHAIKRARGAL